ncbi:MAG: ribonuclease Z [Clostridiales bacterium]|jgi:ribonuclease Z|nr:ribonuclease Z [Clostridiales bacterium]
MLDIALVGCGGMMPLPNRYLSSLLLRHEGRMMLIDCGEGTQVSVKQVGWGFKNIDCICLTHFHADHVAGLPGLLLTIGGSGREEPITIVGPIGVSHIVRSLCVIAPEIPFEINFIEIGSTGSKDIAVPLTSYMLSAAPVDHNCPCFAYRVDIKRTGLFNLEAAMTLPIPRNYWNILQKGRTIEHEGRIYTPDMVLGSQRKGLAVSYCTDSRPPRGLAAFVANSDIFVCEGHYGEDALLDKAKSHKHMLFSEAARLAKAGNVGQLWLTHFSPAMPNPEAFIQNARKIFANSHVGYDRMVTTLSFEDE